MNVLADFHHGDLYYSFQLLFEKRLGWRLFRPIGMEWLNEGYWRYSLQNDTAKQFLGLDQGSLEPERRHNENRELSEDGIYWVWDSVHHTYQKAVTLEKFKQMDFGIVISSVSQHDSTFAKLIADLKPTAKHISHLGNIFQGRNHGIKNLMVSTKPFPVPSDVNTIFYHQEFDTTIYSPNPSNSPTPPKFIKCFMNCLPQLYPEDYAIFNQLKGLLPEFIFKSYGGSCDDGSLHTEKQIAYEMQNSMFGFHCKKLGDGFGHVIHNWLAVGKPVITRGSDYTDKLAGDLLIDGETCFDIEKHSLKELSSIIRSISNIDYQSMCKKVEEKFKQVVNFDTEFEKIKEFLNKLL